MPTRKVVPLKEYTSFEKTGDGWTASFHVLGISGSGATEEDAFRQMVGQLNDVAADEAKREVWNAWAEEHAIEQEIPQEEIEAQQRMVEASHEASKGFEQLTEDTLDACIADGPVLVDFWAEWCMPCHMIAPVLKQVGDRLAGRLAIAKINMDENRSMWERFGIEGIPCMILFRAGAEVHRIVGAGRSVDDMLAEIEPQLT